jgi:hypothetical protein
MAEETKELKSRFFFSFFLLLIERSQSGVGVRSGSIQIVTDPDPGSQKT